MAKRHSGTAISRRGVLAAGVAIPLAALAGSRRAGAQNLELPRLAEDDPAAKALAYHHDASAVSSADFPAMVAGANCANCQLYTGAPDSQWGPCSIFPGKLVNAGGWCRTWVRKAG